MSFLSYKAVCLRHLLEPLPDLILCALAIIVVVGVLLWRMRYSFDVMALGQANAINLGINYRKQNDLYSITYFCSGFAVSTALVGPLTFLGLIVANLAHHISGSSQYRFLMPVAFLLGTIALIGGQLILEYGLKMTGTLSVVIEFYWWYVLYLFGIKKTLI